MDFDRPLVVRARRVRAGAHMRVHATPTAGSVSGATATFSGPGLLIMNGGPRVNIDVSVWADVATQQFQLTVLQLGSMPMESFSSGGVSLR
jgi:hypothetical protein